MFPKEPLNIVTDLAYSVLVTKQIETSLSHPNIPPRLLTIMLQLQKLTCQHSRPSFITHLDLILDFQVHFH
jgi:hypothetical protein